MNNAPQPGQIYLLCEDCKRSGKWPCPHQSSQLDDFIKRAIESANDFNTEYEWTGGGHEDMALSLARAQIKALIEEVIEKVSAESPATFANAQIINAIIEEVKAL